MPWGMCGDQSTRGLWMLVMLFPDGVWGLFHEWFHNSLEMTKNEFCIGISRVIYFIRDQH